MTLAEKAELEAIIMTLGDPRGNWDFAWASLCRLAEMDPQRFRPHFAPHPVFNDGKITENPNEA
jgi:hypothetical protein